MFPSRRIFCFVVIASCFLLIFNRIRREENGSNRGVSHNALGSTNKLMLSSPEDCHFRALSLLEILKNSKKTSLSGDKIRSNYKSVLKLKQKISAIRKSGQKVRLSIGSSHIKTPGFINTDIQELNVLSREDWENLFEDDGVEGVDNLFAEHVFEHLTPRQVLAAAAASFLVLRNGGRWRIAVPDAYFPNKEYQYYVRAGDTGSVQTHMVVYSKDSLPELFEMMGYTISLLEYYDEKGKFHKSNYSEDHGRVKRTLEHDKRNGKGNPQYTSLVFDAEKPEYCKK